MLSLFGILSFPSCNLQVCELGWGDVAGEGTHVTESIATSERAEPRLRTLADKLDWLIDQAHDPARGPYSNAEIAALVGQVTGEKISYGAIWELRTGRTVNPTKRVIEALAQTFGVRAGFFFDDYDDAPPVADQVELLAMIREADVDHGQLRTFLGLPPEARRALTSLIEHTVRAVPSRKRSQA
jgi:transcriptional regulator with XRE-family HTH domain